MKNRIRNRRKVLTIHITYTKCLIFHDGMRGNITHETCAVNAKVKCYRDTFS